MEATSQPCFSQSYLRTQETVPRSSENYHSSLHSTRKQPTKPWKRPVTASPQRMHPRVYRVEPVNFKELVQRLTGAHELEPEVHQVEAKPIKISDDITIAKDNNNPFMFDLSPSSSRFWEAFPLLSPTNLSRW
ncbi:VQ motif-containing protein 29 [Cardamine amara subsp. amara]|uniref:VQ motif-containing protein 29 n=1 Tax=Cardamine amara subsp. amara TaxID=228776 RepID=A0ABD1B422_CARAN